jgi:glutamate-1-semialdehyde 2,1-aminomutase
MLYDVDDNAFIDFHMSWGALIHGHAHPAIVRAIEQQAVLGISYGLSCVQGEQLARLITKCVPFVERVRFVASGTEATMTALRVARGYTGRDYIVKFTGCYHGHADPLLVRGGSGMVRINPTASSAGVPLDSIKYTLCLPYNDLDAARQLLSSAEFRDKIAAVIVEPVAGNMGVVPATREFLQLLREETAKIGALLIFDEVITGFRVALGGAQSIYGIRPDLSCFAKVLGGGTQTAAFGGSKQIMDVLAPQGPVYQAGTFTGNPLSMAVGLESLRLLQSPGVYEELERKTQQLITPVQERLRDKKAPACVQRVGSMFTLFFGVNALQNMEQSSGLDDRLFRQFHHFVLTRGILLPPSQYEASFVSTVHTEAHLIRARDIFLEFIDLTF